MISFSRALRVGCGLGTVNTTKPSRIRIFLLSLLEQLFYTRLFRTGGYSTFIDSTLQSTVQMDILKVAFVSIAETYTFHIFNQATILFSRQVFWPLFIIQYVALKIYWIWIYPLMASPLRSLPGPSVCIHHSVLSLHGQNNN